MCRKEERGSIENDPEGGIEENDKVKKSLFFWEYNKKITYNNDKEKNISKKFADKKRLKSNKDKRRKKLTKKKIIWNNDRRTDTMYLNNNW